jgi:branched-chain amino acid transport system substrate-binding protein
MRYKKKILIPVVAVLAIASLSACSGGNSDAGAGKPPIKIGVSVPLSGGLSTDGTSTLCGARAYFNTVNAAGGTNGYKFDPQWTDNKYDAALSAQVARDYISQGAFALMTLGTAVLTATSPVAQAANVPVVSAADGSTVTPGVRGIYGYNPVYAREGAAGAEFISKTLKGKDAAVVYIAPAAAAGAAAFATTFKDNGGNVLLSEPAASSVTDYAPLAQKLKNSGAPIVYTMLVDAQIAGLQKAAAAIGFKPTWVGWAITYGPSYLKLAGAAAEDTYVASWVTPVTETSNPDVAKFVAAVNAIPECAPLLGTSAVASGYAMAAMITDGVKQATNGGVELTADKFNSVLSNVKDKQYGITPGTAIDDASHALVRQSSWWQVKGSGLAAVRGFEPLPAAK